MSPDSHLHCNGSDKSSLWNWTRLCQTLSYILYMDFLFASLLPSEIGAIINLISEKTELWRIWAELHSVWVTLRIVSGSRIWTLAAWDLDLHHQSHALHHHHHHRHHHPKELLCLRCSSEHCTFFGSADIKSAVWNIITIPISPIWKQTHRNEDQRLKTIKQTCVNTRLASLIHAIGSAHLGGRPCPESP